jgi:hypothetical protein
MFYIYLIVTVLRPSQIFASKSFTILLQHSNTFSLLNVPPYTLTTAFDGFISLPLFFNTHWNIPTENELILLMNYPPTPEAMGWASRVNAPNNVGNLP